MTRPAPPRRDGEVQLWCVRPAAVRDADLLREYEGWLSPAEQTRHRALRFERHRHEYLVTRALVRSVLARYRPVAPAAWRFVLNEFGRPSIDPPCGLRFNLSNTPGLVVCLVSAGAEVGVDVEPLARADQILTVAPDVFSARELAGLGALAGADRRSRAVSLWTLKESYIKARGMGLALSLQAFSFVFDRTANIRIELDPSLADRAERWTFGQFDRSDHRIAVTVEAPRAGAAHLRMWETVPLVSAVECEVLRISNTVRSSSDSAAFDRTHERG